MKKSLIIVVVTAIIASGITFFITDSLKDKNIVKEVKGMDSSQNIDDLYAYIYLLSQDQYNKFNKLVEELEEDEEYEKELTSFVLNWIYKKDPSLKTSISNIIETVSSSKTKDTYFEKNNSCASLVPGIKSGLEPEEDSYFATVEKEFEFIFYSPTLDTCIYSVNRSNTGKSDYSTTVYKEVYNANTQSLIKTYKIYSSEDYKNDEDMENSTNETREYIKYILENSNYNVDLLKDVDYVYL